MARRLAALFVLLAVLGLGLVPLASGSAHCPAGMTLAMTGDDAPCCPDMAPSDSCQVGCVQFVAAPAPVIAARMPQHAHFGMAAPVTGTGWLAPPESEPPRQNLRS